MPADGVRRKKSSRRGRANRTVLWFTELGIRDVPLVGGKNASLGEMYQTLTPQGIRVPNGFAIAAKAYQSFLKSTGLKKLIRSILKDLKTRDVIDLIDRGRRVRRAVLEAELPEDLQKSIRIAYAELERQYGKNVDVAVRSSATAEDLPDASFAGQQETFLNIRGAQAVIEATKRCFASLFTNRAISYRHDKGFDHFRVALSVGVQKMVRSDRACSGVLFTIDTETGFRNAVMINGSWGLGENVVQGRVNPDEFIVFKPTLKPGYQPILKKQLGDKREKLIYKTGSGKPTVNVATTSQERLSFCLTNREVLQLAEWGVAIEEHYRRPMDLEWAKDGVTGKLFIVQARPETVVSQRDLTKLETYALGQKGRVITQGMAIGSKIGKGTARIIFDVKGISRFRPGDVLVTDITDPDWEPIMKIASAIVTDRGGRTSHAAIVSRELGIPAIVGTKNATRAMKNGQKVTVSAAGSSVGLVYAGLLPIRIKTVNIGKFQRPKTKVMMIVGDPDNAFADSFIPNDGIGLCREEFIVASSIKIHPLSLLKYPRLKDERAIREIEKLTAGYPNKRAYFIEKLSQGIGMIAAAFYPKDVIVRLSDFKTNEYAGLIGGKEFEPHEENPMLGWRGAARYYSPSFEPAFALEVKALRHVREQFGLTNVKVMVPMCRTVSEGKKVVSLLRKYGLTRGQKGLEVYVMCEVPANVLLAEEFAKVFDGFSIGSNDLTQFTLALDRDSSLVSSVADERNEAVKKFLAEAIQKVHHAERPIGICGQAPSDFPDVAAFLVQNGIDSISLNPDSVIKTTLTILQAERTRRRR